MYQALISTSLTGTVLVGAVWCLTRLAPRLTPSMRAGLWWCVAAKFAIGLLWTTPVVLPVLPAPAAASTQASTPATAVTITAATIDARPALAAPEASRWPGLDLQAAVVGIWVLGLALSGWVLARRWRRTAMITRTAAPVDGEVVAMVSELAARLGLRGAPRVGTSPLIETPLVVGLVRPCILLPLHRFAVMDEASRRMVLCHELAHVRRGDLWLGLLPALVERVFFFHPLVRYAVREYGFWRESACDAAVLRALGEAPQAYGRLLLELGVCRPQAQPAAAGAARSFSVLKRRMLMLTSPTSPSTSGRFAAAAAVLLSVAASVPVQLGARAATVSVEAPAPPVDAQQTRQDDLRYVYFIDDDTTMMSGRRQDIERARRLRGGSEAILWFSTAGREYVVRDATSLQQVRATWEPVRAVGAEQSALGQRQSAVGVEQSAIGLRQSEIGVLQSEVGSRQSAIGTQQATTASRISRTRNENEMRDLELTLRQLDEQMRSLDKEMRVLDDRMRELEKPMRALDERMAVLDREMEILDRKSEAASKRAEADMRRLLDRLIANGLAEAVR